MARLFLRSAFVASIIALMPQVAAAGNVTLAWDATPDSSVIGYSVLVGTASHTYTSRFDIGNVTQYTVNTGGPGTFYFAVCARSATAISVPSMEVSTTILGATPLVSIDYPIANQVLPSDMVLSGWAADLGAQAGDGIDAVHVYASLSGGAPTFLGVASFGAVRTDVGAMFGSQFTNSGFSFPITGLAPGAYTLTAYGHSTVTGTFSAAGSARITVFSPTAPPAPSGEQVSLDAPAQSSVVRGAMIVGGWSLDLRSTSGTGVDRVDVWGYPQPGSGQQPVFIGTAFYGGSRTDVGKIFGTRYNTSGFTLPGVILSGGDWDVAVLAHSKVSGLYEKQRVARVNVQPAVLMSVDTPTQSATVGAPFMVAGWALDSRSTTNAGVDAVHVWAFPVAGGTSVFLGTATLGVARPDVGSAFGSAYSNSGYMLNVSSLAPGTYNLAVYVHSSVSGQFDNSYVVRITVQ